MSKLIWAVCILLASLPAYCQSDSSYQVGVITEVKQHGSSPGSDSAVPSYDISLRVGDTIYQVLYTPPFDTGTVKYAAGRELLVHVGEKTITYNDILGRSFEVPIVSQKSAPDSKQPKG
jgi:hypothetical protein